MVSFDTNRLIRLLLPGMLRQPIRIAWLESLLAPVIRMWNEYELCRVEKYYEANVTARTIGMEAYLNRLFDPVEKRVRIMHSVSRPVNVSMRGEVSDGHIPGDEGLFIDLNGENAEEIDGFIVRIPEGIDADQVAGVVDRIRAVGVRYKLQPLIQPHLQVIPEYVNLTTTAEDEEEANVITNKDWTIT